MDKTLLNKYLFQDDKETTLNKKSNLKSGNKLKRNIKIKLPEISTIRKIEIEEDDFDFIIKTFDWLIIKFVNEMGLMTENFLQIFSYNDIIIEFENFEILILNLINYIELKKLELKKLKLKNIYIQNNEEEQDLYNNKIKEVLNFFIELYSQIKFLSIPQTYLWFHKS